MQLKWLWRGLRTGVVTTRYPAARETMPPGWRGTAVLDGARCEIEGSPPPCVRVCLPRALSVVQSGPGSPRLQLDHGACIACGLCVTACSRQAMSMAADFELASSSRSRLLDAGNATTVAERPS